MNLREQLIKNWRNRLSLGLITASFFILIDEFVKEGYIFDYQDLYITFPTHEQLFIIFLISGLILGLRKWA